MEVFFAIPLLIIPLMIPVLTGLMATSFGRKFWPWFLLSIPLPFVANVILLCLPCKTETQESVSRKLAMEVVENEHLFDHLFVEDQQIQIVHDEFHFSKSVK